MWCERRWSLPSEHLNRHSMMLFKVFTFLAGASDFLGAAQTELNFNLQAGVFVVLALMAGGLAACVCVLRHLAVYPLDWGAMLDRLAARPLGMRLGFVYAAVLLALWALGITVALLLQHCPKLDLHASATSLIHGFFFQVLGLLVLVGYMRLRGKTWLQMFGVSSERVLAQIGRAIVLYLAAMPLLITTGIAANLLLWWMDYPIGLQQVMDLFRQGLPWPYLAAMLFLVLIVAPVLEETFFRGIGLGLLFRRIGFAPAVLVVSFLFALAHMHLPSFLQLFVLAVVLSLAYVGTGSLLTPIIMHAVFNFVSLALLWLLDAG